MIAILYCTTADNVCLGLTTEYIYVYISILCMNTQKYINIHTYIYTHTQIHTI